MPGLSLTSAVKVFPCPDCRETINTSMQQCTFCNASIDPAAAQQSAAETSRISQSVSDASYLKIMIGVAGAFLLARFTIFFSWFGIFGFAFLEIALTVMLIRWWLRYGRIQTNDPDYAPARKTVVILSIGIALFFLLRLTRIIVITPF